VVGDPALVVAGPSSLVATTPRATYPGRDWRTFWGWKINAGSCANRRKSYESQLNMYDKVELRCTGFAQTALLGRRREQQQVSRDEGAHRRQRGE
jgi:hypothetical protein